MPRLPLRLRRALSSPQRFRRLKCEFLEQRLALSGPGAGSGDAPPFDWSSPEINAIAGQWIARFDGIDGSADEQTARLGALLADAGQTVIEIDQPLGLPGMFTLHTAADFTYQQMADALGSIGGFRYVQPDVLVSGDATPNDTNFGQLYGLHNTGQIIAGVAGIPDADIDAPEAWDLTTGNTSVIVGVIDSGINFTHPDLLSNIWVNPGEIAGNGLDDDANGFVDDNRGWDFFQNDNDPTDAHGHGTHVAGTIGARGNNAQGVTGVNWRVSILPLRFLGPANTGPLSAAVRAINYATMMNSRGHNIKVTNNSWGGGAFPAEADAIQAHRQAGILFVAAAGNNFTTGGDNIDTLPTFPASYPYDNQITVAATNNRDQLAFFSNFGASSVDLAAPGENIFSTLLGTSYGFFNGTSMATPHVTGVAALIWSLAPSATYQTVKQAILNSVDLLPSLTGKVATGGRLNARRAVEPFVDSEPPLIPQPLTPVAPPGSMIHVANTAGVINSPSDVDTFTLPIDPRQRLSIVLSPIDGALRLSVQIVDAAGTIFSSVVAGSAGQRLVINDQGLSAVSPLSIVVSGAGGTVGPYTIETSLNGRFEQEGRLTTTNNTIATAENLLTSFSGLAEVLNGPARTGVLGRLANTGDADFYFVNLQAGESLTVAGRALRPDKNLQLQVLNASGAVVATGVQLAGRVLLDATDAIDRFSPTVSGNYYVRVFGDSNNNYTLVLTASSTFELEANETAATAQVITGAEGVLGAIAPSTKTSLVEVVPGANTSLEGNFDNSFPFNLAPFNTPSMRYQQIYDRTEFASRGIIDALRFRRDQQFGAAFSLSALDVRISLSYAATTVLNPSTIFANNIGPARTTVYDGWLILSSGTVNSLPRPMDIVIDVANLFDYDPALGDLLLDIEVRNSPTTTSFDAVGTNQSSTARIFAAGVNSASGSAFRSGLVTRFDLLQPPIADWYAIDIPTTQHDLRLTTRVPASGAGQFVNNLVPQIELFDPAGNPVGTTSVVDGNPTILLDPATTGRYRVRISGQNGTQGTYFLWSNFSPLAVDLTVNSPVVEGGTATLTGRVADPDSREVFSVAVQWGDGATSFPSVDPATRTFIASRLFADDNPNGTPIDTLSVTVQVSDGLNTSTASIPLQIANAPPELGPLTVDSPVNESTIALLTGSYRDPGRLDSQTLLIDWDDPSAPAAPVDLRFSRFSLPSFGALFVGRLFTSTTDGVALRINSLDAATGTVGFEVAHFYADDGPAPGNGTPADISNIVVTITDNDTGVDSATVLTTVVNVAPELEISFSATNIDENGSVTLSGSFTDPTPLDTFTVNIDWGDGVETLHFTAGDERAFSRTHQYLDDSPTGTPADNYTVTVTVTDDDSGSDTASGTILVANLAPTIASLESSATYSAPAGTGAPVTLDAVFADVGTLDTHTATIDWGDGSQPEAATVIAGVGGGTVAASHAYAAGGVFTATITLVDDDTASATEQTVAVVVGAGIQDGVLQVVGTAEDDQVHVNRTGTGIVKVHANFFPESVREFPMASIDRIRVWLLSGDDQATLAGNVNLPVLMDGGSGNDSLNSAEGATILLGGLGDDHLTGGKGRSILIGGSGADRIVGGPGENVIIGAATAYDGSDNALLALLEEWNSSRSYTERVANLRSGSGPVLSSTGLKLVAGETVLDDDAVDLLTGASGLDWFLFDLEEDEVTDLKSAEEAN